MSSSDRRQFLSLIVALPLAGCGFTPAYAPGAPANALRGRVEADAPTSRDAFTFVARIEDRLGRPDAPAYRLTYGISTYRTDLAVTTAGSILRYQISGTISWSLIETATGNTLASGTAQSFTGASATLPTVAAQAADVDARLRLMRILADQVVTKLLASSASWPKA